MKFFSSLQSGQGYSVAVAPQPLPNSIPMPLAKSLPQNASQGLDQGTSSGIGSHAANANIQSGMQHLTSLMV